MLDNEQYFDAIGDLSSDDFSLDSHKRIFGAIAAIMDGMEEGVRSADIITLPNVLRKRDELSHVGGVAYLASLTEGLPARMNITEHVRIIREKAKLRMLMEVGKNLDQSAEAQTLDSSTLIENMQERLMRSAAEETTDSVVRVGDIAPEVEKKVLAKRNQSLDKTALDLTWGIDKLDEFTKGLFGGELTILAAESGGGKTAMMLQIILANALLGVPCLISSMEMKREKLVQRLYPQLSHIIQSKHVRDPRLIALSDITEIQRLTKVMASLPIWIDDRSPMTLQKLKARAKMMIRRHKIRLWAGDYFQLINVPGAVGVEKIEQVAFGMRDFAKSEPDVHTLLLSQFSKASGFMKKQRRTKNDLMGGSAIHHAAQNVVIVTVESAAKRDPDDLLDTEITIDKQRDGLTGRVTCAYDRKRLRFVSQEEKENGGNSGNGKDRSAGS